MQRCHNPFQVAMNTPRRPHDSAGTRRSRVLTARLLAFLFTTTLPAPVPAIADVKDLVEHEKLWEMSPEACRKQFADLTLQWTSRDRRQLRTTRAGALAEGVDVCELLINSEDDRLSDLAISLYNRGDAGTIPMERFQTMGRTMTEYLNELAGSRPRPVGRMRATGIRREGRQWTRDQTVFRLEWALSTNGGNQQPEYLRLRILPMDKARDERRIAHRPQDLRANIRKTDEGDVYLDAIPMVDQGQKGYCAVAVAERLMRYYDRPVDQHQLAQIAGTHQAGTDPESLRKALLKFSGRLGVRIRELIAFDMRDFQRLLKQYNRMAKRMDRPQYELPRSGTINLTDVYDAMDAEILHAARLKDGTGFRNFLNDLRSHVTKGVPLMWGVMLGKVKEPSIPQLAGGHMRLLIGYNDQTDEVLFSDTWGRGHERKRMSAEDAWTITTSLYVMTPK